MPFSDPHLGFFGTSGGAGGGIINYSDNRHPGSASTSHTHTLVDIGTPSVSRFVVCGFVNIRDVGVVTNTVTINGVSATKLAEINVSSSSICYFGAVVPTGTLVTISQTNSIFSFTGMVVWWSPGVLSTTVTDSASDTVDTAGLLTTTVSPLAGGFILSLASVQQVPTWTWSGNENPVEVIDGAFGLGTGNRGWTAAQVSGTVGGASTVEALASPTTLSFERMLTIAMK